MTTTPEGLLRRMAQPGDSLDSVWERLTSAIHAMGIPVFAIIDHRQNALTAGLTMHGARLVIFGNPGVGTKLMCLSPEIALDLPLRFLAEETPAGVCLVWNDPAWLASRHGIDNGVEAVAKMRSLMLKLVEAAVPSRNEPQD